MTISAVILLIVYFSCNVNSELNENPKLPVFGYDENGNLQSSISPRIVGGVSADPGEFQGQISLQQAASYPYLVYHFCGGTLIQSSHVLTAAHCVTTSTGVVRSPSYFMLVGDELYINYISISRQSRSASHVFVHPQYSISGIQNDVAVIRASSPFTVSDTFSPVPLIRSSPSAGTVCSVAGWGATYFDGPLSPRLLRINATIISKDVCNGPDSYEGNVQAGMLCAGNMAGGTDACQGDSGGGLICGNYVAGIVSWGVKCALPNLPGVYADVAVYYNWINEQTVWEGQHEDIPTPTTIIADTNPNGSTIAFISLKLLTVCVLSLIMR